MNQMDEKKMNVYAFIVALILVLILLITGAFAWIRIARGSNKVNVLRAETLSLILDESTTSGIKLKKELPKSYRQGILNTAYTFKLQNNSSINTDYTITIVDDYDDDSTITDNEKIADDLIRYVLVKDGVGLTPSNSKILKDNRIIDSGTIVGKSGVNPTEISYTLYVWIDSKAGDNDNQNDIMDKLFNGKLSIEAIQHHN